MTPTKPPTWAKRAALINHMCRKSCGKPMERHKPNVHDEALTIAAEFDKTGLAKAVKDNLDECESFQGGFCDTPGHVDLSDALARTTEVEDE